VSSRLSRDQLPVKLNLRSIDAVKVEHGYCVKASTGTEDHLFLVSRSGTVIALSTHVDDHLYAEYDDGSIVKWERCHAQSPRAN